MQALKDVSIFENEKYWCQHMLFPGWEADTPHQGNLLPFSEKDFLSTHQVISMGDADLRLVSWSFRIYPLAVVAMSLRIVEFKIRIQTSSTALHGVFVREGAIRPTVIH
jgi:hypothetical protein